MKPLNLTLRKNKYGALKIGLALLGLINLALIPFPTFADSDEMGMPTNGASSPGTNQGSGQGMGMQMDGMNNPDPNKASGQGMMDMDMMEMMGMTQNGNQGGADTMNMSKDPPPPSAIPGFPGTSHIYHVGATGFFLDHSEHLNLTSEQNAALNTIKEESGKNQEDLKTKIETLESELWTLTGSDTPDIRKITDKVKTIESLRTEKRLSFIRAVGKAADTLNQKQREALVGNMK